MARVSCFSASLHPYNPPMLELQASLAVAVVVLLFDRVAGDLDSDLPVGTVSALPH